MTADPEARIYRFAGRGTLVPLLAGVMPISMLELSGGESPDRSPQGLHSVVRPQRRSQRLGQRSVGGCVRRERLDSDSDDAQKNQAASRITFTPPN